jgi:hypothetical protein
MKLKLRFSSVCRALSMGLWAREKKLGTARIQEGAIVDSRTMTGRDEGDGELHQLE